MGVSAIFGSGMTIDGVDGLLRRRSALPGTVAINLTTDLLPRVSGATFMAVDPARPSLGWTAAGSLAAADMLRVACDWDDGGVNKAWVITGPPTTASPVRAPALPAALAAFRPIAGVIYRDRSVLAFDMDWIAGWAVLKAGGLGTPPADVEYRFSGSFVP